jgi:hypothetical protein
MSGRGLRNYWVVFLLIAVSCLEKYEPPEIKTAVTPLVVDGFLNLADNTATVRLARTSKLSDKLSSTPEKQAIVSIQEIGNPTLFPLTETQNGIYTGSGLSLSLAKKYQLHIRTKALQSYSSDPVEIKKTPPIDSVYFEAAEDGIQIYIATHDPAADFGYYLWSYTETWQHNALYDAAFKIQNGRIVPRPAAEKSFNCWSTVNSSNIFVGSTKKLSENLIRFPIVFIPKGSIKLSIKYSILVQQQALTESGFLYWQQLKKTTESIGGLFDPLPSSVAGNVHNVSDASEQVLGYIDGGSREIRRIYINPSDLPLHLQHAYGFGPCDIITLEGSLSLYNGVAVLSATSPDVSAGNCSDCRKDGGTTVKPDFWP